ncbi:MAG: SAM-dependent methyltransferase [Gemmatimonadota bacterium]
MAQAPQVPLGVDPEVPAPARMYDYFLGGSHNFDCDRVAAAKVREAIPEVVDAAWANRGFHQRAARWLAEQGISQFIDIGSGLPTVGNTHEVVQQITPGARVVYVDHDPLVIAHSSGLLTDPATVRVVQADLREPESVLNHPDVRALIDFRVPFALLMTAVLHFVAPDDDPWGLVARYISELPSGGYLVLSHVTDEKTPPISVRVAEEMYARASEQIYFRSRADVARFLAGLELVSPGPPAPGSVVHAGEWGADDPALADTDGSHWLYCGVGRRP